MTTDSTGDDQLLEELYPQMTEHLAAQYAADDDLKAGRDRFTKWLNEHTGPQEDAPVAFVTAIPARLKAAALIRKARTDVGVRFTRFALVAVASVIASQVAHKARRRYRDGPTCCRPMRGLSPARLAHLTTEDPHTALRSRDSPDRNAA
jgi:hypothetical protein